MKFLINENFDGPNESNIFGWGSCRLENGVYYATNKFGTVQYPMTQYPNMYIGEVLDEYLPEGFSNIPHYNIAYSYDPGGYSLYPTEVTGWRINEIKKNLMIQALKTRNQPYYFASFVYNNMQFYYDKYVQRDLDTIMRHIVYFGEYPEGTAPEWMDIYGNILALPTPEDFKEFYKVVNNKRAVVMNVFHDYKKRKITSMLTYEDLYREYRFYMPQEYTTNPPTPDVIFNGLPSIPAPTLSSSNEEDAVVARPTEDEEF